MVFTEYTIFMSHNDIHEKVNEQSTSRRPTLTFKEIIYFENDFDIKYLCRLKNTILRNLVIT